MHTDTCMHEYMCFRVAWLHARKRTDCMHMHKGMHACMALQWMHACMDVCGAVG